ncbi:MAG: hypothetical protein ACT4QG_22680 [Sporichthyaceae bacterium]
MTEFRSSRKRFAALAGATGAFALVASAMPTSAVAAPSAFDFVDSSYILTLRSGGFEPYAYIPRDLPTNVGHSYVDLIHDRAQERGRCETLGAGYWLGGETEEGVLGPGAAPPDAGDVSGGYRNPTVMRDTAPNISPGANQSAKDPGVRNYFPPGNEILDIPSNGNGPKWQATCDSDTLGSATGDVVNVGGFQLVGSTALAEVDKATGVYTGTSRAYVFGLEGASGFDSASSFMQVVNKPNQKPTITYRMTYFNSGDNKNKSGFTFGGSDIPVEDFAKAFNDGAKAFGEAAKPIGPIGAGTLTPEVGVTTDGNRYSITISAGHGNLGFAAREGTVGGNQGMRIGSVTFSGVYGDA